MTWHTRPSTATRRSSRPAPSSWLGRPAMRPSRPSSARQHSVPGDRGCPSPTLAPCVTWACRATPVRTRAGRGALVRWQGAAPRGVACPRRRARRGVGRRTVSRLPGWLGRHRSVGSSVCRIPRQPGTARPPSELLDWVSASAWAEAPWDPDLEDEDEVDDQVEDHLDQVEGLPGLAVEDVEDEPVEALQAPKVPAALPMRRRRPPASPIRTHGSGEWLYADPPAREPLARRGGGIGSPVLLAVLGLLVVSLVVFLLPTLLGGGAGDGRTAGAASPSPGVPARVVPTRAPLQTPDASPSPSPTPEPEDPDLHGQAG